MDIINLSHCKGFISVIRDGGVRDGIIHPGQDLTGMDQQIIDYAAEVWTPEVLDAFAEQQASEAPPPQSQSQLAKSKIAQIEAQTMVPRLVREFMLLQAVYTANAMGIQEPQLYATNMGYKKAKDIEAIIDGLRSQIVK